MPNRPKKLKRPVRPTEVSAQIEHARLVQEKENKHKLSDLKTENTGLRALVSDLHNKLNILNAEVNQLQAWRKRMERRDSFNRHKLTKSHIIEYMQDRGMLGNEQGNKRPGQGRGRS